MATVMVDRIIDVMLCFDDTYSDLEVLLWRDMTSTNLRGCWSD